MEKILFIGSAFYIQGAKAAQLKFFNLGRGCRQGDPLSPYIFLLAIEPLAMAIKDDKTIGGITIDGKTHTIGQYADDTFLMLEKDEQALRRSENKHRKNPGSNAGKYLQ